MIIAIRTIAVVLISYCVVQLAQTCDTAEAQEWACYYGDDSSMVFSVMAKSRREAEDKIEIQVPDRNFEVFCKPKKQGD